MTVMRETTRLALTRGALAVKMRRALADRLADPKEVRDEVEVAAELDIDETQCEAILNDPSFRVEMLAARDGWIERQMALKEQMDNLAVYAEAQGTLIRVAVQEKLAKLAAKLDVSAQSNAVDWKNGKLDALLNILRAVRDTQGKVIIQNNAGDVKVELTEEEADRAINAYLKQRSTGAGGDGAGQDRLPDVAVRVRQDEGRGGPVESGEAVPGLPVSEGDVLGGGEVQNDGGA